MQRMPPPQVRELDCSCRCRHSCPLCVCPFVKVTACSSEPIRPCDWISFAGLINFPSAMWGSDPEEEMPPIFPFGPLPAGPPKKKRRLSSSAARRAAARTSSSAPSPRATEGIVMSLAATQVTQGNPPAEPSGALGNTGEAKGQAANGGRNADATAPSSSGERFDKTSSEETLAAPALRGPPRPRPGTWRLASPWVGKQYIQHNHRESKDASTVKA